VKDANHDIAKNVKPQNNECSQCYSIFLNKHFNLTNIDTKMGRDTLLPNAFEEYFEALENLKESKTELMMVKMLKTTPTLEMILFLHLLMSLLI